MSSASASDGPGGVEPPTSGRRWRWLQADEGWAASEDAVRLLAAVAIAFLAVGFKLVILRLLGGEVGYLSYVGAVTLAAWIAGSRGGVITTLICAIAEAGLFSGTLNEFLASPLTELRFVLFLSVGVLVTWITSHLRRVTVRERSARAIGEERLEAQVAAYRAAERDRAALAGLQAVTASLAGAATPEEVADAILDRGMTALGARAGAVSRLAGDGRNLDLIAARGYPDEVVANWAHFDLARRSHLRDAVTGGVPVFLGDPVAWVTRYPESGPAPLPDSPTGGALAVLPLSLGGRTIGTVVFRFALPQELDGPTRDLAQRLADQGAQALDRALAYELERSARNALERSGDRLRFLAETSELLASGVDIETTVSALPRLAIPAIADWCAVGLFEVAGGMRSAAGTTLQVQAAADRLAALAPRDIGPWLALAAPAGAVVSIAGDPSGWLGDPQAGALLDQLSTRSLVAVPIGGPAAEPAGWLILGSARADWYGPDDLGAIRDAVGRIEVAAERSRLFAAVTRFKATVDVSEDAVFMFDPDSLLLTYANRGGTDLVGFAAADLHDQSILRIQPEAHHEAFRSRLTEVRRSSGRSGAYTGVLARRDGGEIPVDARLQEVTLPDGARTVILTARDISARIEVQARLARIAGDERRNAAELRAVIHAMGEGILVADPSGRISLANEAAAAILGGDVPASLAGLEDALWPAAEPDEDATEATPEIDAQPRTVRLDDGRWLEITSYPADLAGTVAEETRASRIVVLRDVTRAREAEAAREAFLGVLSHELRTPVTTIFGWAKVLQRPGHRPDRVEMLADIEVEADRLYRIVEDLLALTRVEGGIRVEGEPLLVQHLVGSLVAAEARRWPGITFEVDIPSNLPAVFGERTYVEQVLRNLVSNSGKYSPSGTLVTVEAEATPGEVMIRVLDRGRGIDAEEADRLFELYYRSSNTARIADGAGIGLYIGRGLVTAMGGRIWALPRPGGGSEFGFSLPRCEDDVLVSPVVGQLAVS